MIAESRLWIRAIPRRTHAQETSEVKKKPVVEPPIQPLGHQQKMRVHNYRRLSINGDAHTRPAAGQSCFK